MTQFSDEDMRLIVDALKMAGARSCHCDPDPAYRPKPTGSLDDWCACAGYGPERAAMRALARRIEGQCDAVRSGVQCELPKVHDGFHQGGDTYWHRKQSDAPGDTKE